MQKPRFLRFCGPGGRASTLTPWLCLFKSRIGHGWGVFCLLFFIFGCIFTLFVFLFSFLNSKFCFKTRKQQKNDDKLPLLS